MGGAVVDGCCCWAARCAAAPFLFSLPSPALEVSRPIVHLLGFRASPKIPTSDVFFKQGCNFTFKRVTFSNPGPGPQNERFSARNLPKAPGLDCEDLGLVDPFGLCPTAGLWRLNLASCPGRAGAWRARAWRAFRFSARNLPKAPGLDCEDLGLIDPFGLCPTAGLWRLNLASCPGRAGAWRARAWRAFRPRV